VGVNAGSEKIFRPGADVYSAAEARKPAQISAKSISVSHRHTRARARALMHAKEEKTLAKFHIHYNGLNE